MVFTDLLDISLKETYAPSPARTKPTPPPKPATKRFGSIHQYLTNQGECLTT